MNDYILICITSININIPAKTHVNIHTHQCQQVERTPPASERLPWASLDYPGMSLVKQALNIPSLDEIRADGKMKCHDSARK